MNEDEAAWERLEGSMNYKDTFRLLLSSIYAEHIHGIQRDPIDYLTCLGKLLKHVLQFPFLTSVISSPDVEDYAR